MKALLSIVLLLAFGVGVWGNTSEDIARWKEFAENGNTAAQDLLGFAYASGDGVPQDDKEAVRWYRKAAEQGHPNAQFSRGSAYFFGEGVIEDKVQAYAWYNIAAANGDEGGKKFKTLVAEEMTKEQIAEAQKLSREMVEANPKLIN
jgi:TPR repeat protein